ncbi:MAG TPA: hypothetical protein VFZ49_07145 [Pyrinomonadaceae bacterium]
MFAFLAASYAIGLVGYTINNTSHTPSEFSHFSVLTLAFVFVLTSYFLSRRFGNTQFLGIKVIAATALMGSAIAAVLFALIAATIHGPSSLADEGLGLIGAIFYAVIAFPVAMVIRLISSPIVNVFER